MTGAGNADAGVGARERVLAQPRFGEAWRVASMIESRTASKPKRMLAGPGDARAQHAAVGGFEPGAAARAAAVDAEKNRVSFAHLVVCRSAGHSIAPYYLSATT